MFGLGPLEIVIIVVIVVVVFGPGIFKKLGKRGKETIEATKKGIENGAAAAGVERKATGKDDGDLADRISGFQDKVGSWLDEQEAKSGEKAGD